MKQLTGLLLLFFLAIGGVSAQTAPTTAMPPQHQASTAQAAHFDVEAATNAYMAELSPAQRARSDAYFEGGYWLILWDLLVALGVAWLLLGTRLSARMRNLAERITRLPSRDDLEGREPGRSNGAKQRCHHAGGRVVSDRLKVHQERAQERGRVRLSTDRKWT